MNNDLWDEVVKLVADYDAARTAITKEYRLYYNTDGTIVSLWESDHPEGNNYIVLDNPGVFYHTNTMLLRVRDKKLIVLDPRAPTRTRLKKSIVGFPVVKNNSALILEANETYTEVEYYDRTNN